MKTEMTYRTEKDFLGEKDSGRCLLRYSDIAGSGEFSDYRI